MTRRELSRRAFEPFGAVPPLVSDIGLSVDDRWLYTAGPSGQRFGAAVIPAQRLHQGPF